MSTRTGPADPGGAGRTAMLRRCAAQVDAAHQEIHAAQQQLSRRVERLRVGWQEPAAVSFYRGYCRIDAGIEEMKESLDDLHGHLVDPRTPS